MSPDGKKSKLEVVFQQLALNVNYGLSDYHKHKLYTVNPQVKQLPSVPDSQVSQCCGLAVPHWNPHIRD